MKKWNLLVLTLVLSVVLAACGGTEETETSEEGGTEDNGNLGEESLTLSYVEWDSEIASTYVIQKVLEDAGYSVEITPLDNAIMWQSVATGESDGMVSAWLPLTHGDLYDEYEEQFEDLGANLEGAKIGMVVPQDFPVDSIADLSDEAGQTVTGIEPGAGVVQAAENAVEEYDNLEGWEVQTSSSGAMATELGQAMENGEEIVVTGWSPHWKFQVHDLKYLDDPEGIFGEEEHINTIVRQGLGEDSPHAYDILDNFSWTTEDMEAVMLDIEEGASPEEAATTWVEENQDMVSEWTQ
ncbi:glycine betaine ABC transporter substrate-binding protein [Salinicoccus bachuensis]|uniref:Glycine betaine ABC transporter substrate-binding protein n=1 Tax=Salinicoccus bachuensis TaxID=3136731 RepID=A0ABZ3CIY7_9STAP